jgi:hypothetical protein
MFGIESVVAAAALGFASGYLAGRRPTIEEKPLTLVRTMPLMAVPMQVAPAPADPFVRAEGWRMALGQFVTWAAPLDFSRARVLAAGICSRPSYDKFMFLLRHDGAVVTFAKSGTVWGAGWDKRKYQALLRRGLVRPPYPTDTDAPRVLHTRALQSQASQPSHASQGQAHARTW